LAPGKAPPGRAFAVGATVGVAGLVGFFRENPNHSTPTFARTHRWRDTWKKKLDAARAENAAHLRTVRLVVRAGPDTIAERGSP